MITKTGGWFQDEVKCSNGQIDNCYGEYNREILDLTETPARIFLYGLIIVLFILCLCAYRWRFLASYLIYGEILTRLAVVFIPNSKSYHSNANVFMFESFSYCFVTYCGDRLSAILAVITYAVQIFFCMHVVYLRPLSVLDGMLLVLRVGIFIFVFSFVFTSIAYVTRLHN